MSAIDWCRLWHDMPTDPKFRVVAKRAGRPTSEVLAIFTAMLVNASGNDDERGALRNWSHEDMGVALDIEPEHAEAIYQAMQGKLLDGDRLTGWERRQPKREDGSAERAKAWRERKRTQANADERERAIDPDPDLGESLGNTSPSEQDAARVGEGKVDFVGMGLGKGGVVSPEARRKVAARLAIADAGPLVGLYENWRGSRRARDPDALFIRTAEKFFRKAGAEVKAACRPLANEPIPIRPTIVPRASSQLVASLNRRTH